VWGRGFQQGGNKGEFGGVGHEEKGRRKCFRGNRLEKALGRRGTPWLRGEGSMGRGFRKKEKRY